MSLIPEREFKECVDRYKGNYRCRNFTCRDQFFVMSYAQLTGRGSLRDIENCLSALSNRLYHCGISYAVPRNTLARANECRSWQIYADFAQILVRRVRPLYATDNNFRLDLDNMVYAFDSSTISLCLKLCPWAKFRKEKGGVKMHTLLDLRGNMPVSVYLTDASFPDNKAMDKLCVEAGAIYLIDKGYVDFLRLHSLIHERRAYFVTRMKARMHYDVKSNADVDTDTGVCADQRILLTGKSTSKLYPEELRLVTYEDYATGVVYKFVTNHMEYDPLTIAELYRERWHVELFFKWIKQHLHIKSFYGTSENAVYLQIWIAVCTYLLLAYAKKRMGIDQSMHTIAKNIGLFLTDKTYLGDLFAKNPTKETKDKTTELTLFDLFDF